MAAATSMGWVLHHPTHETIPTCWDEAGQVYCGDSTSSHGHHWVPVAPAPGVLHPTH